MGTRLYRSRDDRMLAGVAGGLAELWDADPSLIRIVWALLVVVTGGLALVVYIVMAIVVPEEDDLAPVAPFATAPPPAPGGATTDPASTTAAASTSGPPSWIGPSGTVPAGVDWRSQRQAERDARRAARRARRAAGNPDSRNGAIVIGGLLVVIGSFFLVREYLPTIDFDWFWPAALVVLGVVVLVTAVGSGRSGSGDRP